MDSGLKGLVVAASLLTLGTVAGIKHSATQPVLEDRLELANSALVGHTITDFNTRALTGIQGLVTDSTIQPDYQQQLRNLFLAKDLNNPTIPRAKRLGERLLQEYDQITPTRMSFADYTQKATHAINQTSVDWGRVEQVKLAKKPQRLPLLQEISKSLDGRDLLSYSVTELVGTSNAKRSIAAYDQVLQGAGREYIESVPSLGDALPSVGPYQVIPQAVEEINRVHGTELSLEELRGDEHHEAAYRLAVVNLADLVRSVDDTQLATLQETWRENKDALVQYLAVAHYRPVSARAAARVWLDDGASTQLSFYLSDSGNLKPRSYADKTLANLEEMHSEPAWKQKPAFPENFFVKVGSNSEGLDVMRYNVRPGDHRMGVAKLFNDFNQEALEGKYRPVTFEGIVDVNGSEPDVIHPGNSLYVLTTSAADVSQ